MNGEVIAGVIGAVSGFSSGTIAWLKARQVGQKKVDSEAWDRATKFTDELMTDMKAELADCRSRSSKVERALNLALIRVDVLTRLMGQQGIDVPPAPLLETVVKDIYGT